MEKNELKDRTKKFGIKTLCVFKELPKNLDNHTLRSQVIRSATSVGANYRAACRGKSERDFAYKINIVEEEADECVYWFELLLEMNPDNKTLIWLHKESVELTRIFTAIGKSMKKKLNGQGRSGFQEKN